MLTGLTPNYTGPAGECSGSAGESTGLAGECTGPAGGLDLLRSAWLDSWLNFYCRRLAVVVFVLELADSYCL